MIFILIAAVLVVGAVALYLSTDRLSQFGAKPSGARLERLLQSPNFDGKTIINPIETNLEWSFGDYVDMLPKWLFGRQKRTPDTELPVVKLGNVTFQADPPEGLRILWMGHSSLLIEIDGKRILTDPAWSERCSPSSLYGPKRFHPPPIRLEDLPPLDAVIVSHDHFDHLDKHAVLILAETGVSFILPLGVGSHLESWGVDESQIIELDWWDTHSIDDTIDITAAPARHFSGRAPWRGMNKTLWATWVMAGKRHRVFFSGDTGDFPGLTEIGERFGPFDITCLKIGAYGEHWPDIHLNPEQAVEAHLALRGEVLLPIHWGTFNLAFHDWYEPAERLLSAAEVSGTRIALPRPGEPVSPAEALPMTPWWRDYR